MTRLEVIALAREANCGWTHNGTEPVLVGEQIVRFANLVAAAEREACAKFVEDGYVLQFERYWREDLSAAIRSMK